MRCFRSRSFFRDPASGLRRHLHHLSPGDEVVSAPAVLAEYKIRLESGRLQRDLAADGIGNGAEEFELAIG